MIRTFITAAVLLIGSSTVAAVGRDLPSPDGQLIATIDTVGSGKGGESQIEIRDRAGKVLVRKSYASDDGEHGEIVEQAKWTPDSQFFVYSMYSSGGHRPSRSPTDFYSRKSNLIQQLAARVALIADPEFHVIAPSIVELFGRRVATDDRDGWFRLDLRELR